MDDPSSPPPAEARSRLDPEYGDPATADEQRDILVGAGLSHLIEIPAAAQDWRDYDDRTLDGIRAWLERFPDDTEYMERQLRFENVRAADNDVGWQVWIGQVE
ncbi:MAG: hypothetical protein ACR2QK_19640 [Acidimicrobiales bacterium]